MLLKQPYTFLPSGLWLGKAFLLPLTFLSYPSVVGNRRVLSPFHRGGLLVFTLITITLTRSWHQTQVMPVTASHRGILEVRPKARVCISPGSQIWVTIGSYDPWGLEMQPKFTGRDRKLIQTYKDEPTDRVWVFSRDSTWVVFLPGTQLHPVLDSVRWWAC